MPKRLENQLYLGCPLGTPKNTIFDVKTSPRWTPKISDFFHKSSENASYHGLGSKMPLGSFQEPAKSLPGASQEPFQRPQEAPKLLQDAPCSLPSVVSEAPKMPKDPSLNSCLQHFMVFTKAVSGKVYRLCGPSNIRHFRAWRCRKCYTS